MKRGNKHSADGPCDDTGNKSSILPLSWFAAYYREKSIAEKEISNKDPDSCSVYPLKSYSQGFTFLPELRFTSHQLGSEHTFPFFPLWWAWSTCSESTLPVGGALQLTLAQIGPFRLLLKAPGQGPAVAAAAVDLKKGRRKVGGGRDSAVMKREE